MDWFILISILLFGALLVMVEILFIPGTTVVGVLGIIFTAVGIYYGFMVFEQGVALTVLGIAVLVNILMVVYGFRSGLWNRFSLKETISSRSFDDRLIGLEKGQRGRTLSDCKPFGKVEIGDKIYEAKSTGGFIPTGTEVIIEKIENNKIIIKQ